MIEPVEIIRLNDKEYDELVLGLVKIIPLNWNLWDKIVVNGSKTCQEFIDYVKKNIMLMLVLLLIMESILFKLSYLLIKIDILKKIEDISKY